MGPAKNPMVATHAQSVRENALRARGSLKAEVSLMRVAPSARTATSGGPVGAMAPPREDVYALLTLTLKRGSVRTVRDWLMAQMTALTASPSWRALLSTQRLESASVLKARIPVLTVPSAKRAQAFRYLMCARLVRDWLTANARTARIWVRDPLITSARLVRDWLTANARTARIWVR